MLFIARVSWYMLIGTKVELLGNWTLVFYNHGKFVRRICCILPQNNFISPIRMYTSTKPEAHALFGRAVAAVGDLDQSGYDGKIFYLLRVKYLSE